MDDLECMALLGDRQAQEECTEKGIVLLCPKCYGKSNVYHLATDVKLCIGFSYVYCEECGLQTKATWPPMPYEVCDKKAISQWNTRHAPPIGRCEDCIHYFQSECLKIYDEGACSEYARQERKPDDFCSYFKSIASPEQ